MSPSPLPTPFSLLSWNLLADSHITPAWYPRVPPQDLRGPIRRARVLEQLVERACDVMVLQEVAADLVPELRRLFPDHGLAHVAHCGEGLVVLVRGRTPWSRVLDLPASRKRALLVTLPGGWKLANVHLSWTGPPGPGARRGLEQLETVLSYSPDLIVGDFNAFPSWPERCLAKTAGYLDVTPHGPTCNVKDWLQPLDAVMVRRGWRCEATPLDALDRRTVLPNPRLASDHLPVRVELAPAVGG